MMKIRKMRDILKSRIQMSAIILFVAMMFFHEVAWGEEKPEVFVQLGHKNMVESVSFSPDGRYALSGSSDSTISVTARRQSSIISEKIFPHI